MCLYFPDKWSPPEPKVTETSQFISQNVRNYGQCKIDFDIVFVAFVFTCSLAKGFATEYLLSFVSIRQILTVIFVIYAAYLILLLVGHLFGISLQAFHGSSLFLFVSLGCLHREGSSNYHEAPRMASESQCHGYRLSKDVVIYRSSLIKYMSEWCIPLSVIPRLNGDSIQVRTPYIFLWKISDCQRQRTIFM